MMEYVSEQIFRYKGGCYISSNNMSTTQGQQADEELMRKEQEFAAAIYPQRLLDKHCSR